MHLDFVALRDYFTFIKAKPAFQVLDADAADDLELDLLFAKFAKCKSAVGLQYFYAKLRFFEKPFSDEFTPYHPFIENCVANDFYLDKKSAVITGSNMSGKTSFIRSVAVNAIFAQNFGFCFAKKYYAPPLEILSSIAVSDNIAERKSYYLEEVLRIREFMEKRENFSLILIDEIFKGTNTKERIAISKAVLEQLNSEKKIVMITTHDTEIAQFLEGKGYNLYYFDESVGSGGISFPYKVYEGLNAKTNALKILELYDYPPEVTARARHFLE